MKRLAIPLGIAALFLAAIFGFASITRGQGETKPDGSVVLKSESQGDNVREVTGPSGSDPDAPAIGFIDSPTSTCYQPDPTQDACYINWYYMAVDANPNYMVAMTATINAIGPVIRYSGFFQTSMYAPYNMQDKGIKVSCGALGDGGNPNLGAAYAWTIRAVDSSNLKSANYGTVYCPAYAP